jgi:hypothetical protein
VRRGQPHVAERLVVLGGLVELELVFQLLVELQRVQLVLEFLLELLLELVELVVLGLTPATPAPGARPAPGAFVPQRVSA